jgi:predicted secreted protein
MKKKVLLVLFITMCLCLVGCEKKPDDTKPNDKKTVTFRLYSNGSTGYSWYYELDNKDIVNIKQEYDNGNCGDRDGCGGENVYTITGKKAGKATLKMNYCFVQKERCDKDVTYVFEVDKDLNITETHSGSYYENR